jgi:hypothetical protein
VHHIALLVDGDFHDHIALAVRQLGGVDHRIREKNWQRWANIRPEKRPIGKRPVGRAGWALIG